MYLLTLFLYFSVVYVYQVKGGVCDDDCILITECKHLVDLFNSDRSPRIEKMIKAAACGYEYVRGIKTHKVCCSSLHPNVLLLPESCGDIDGNRIIGGTIASLYEFPWLVLISYITSYGKEFQCGGSIINSRYILTAAHCVRGQIIAGVRIGEIDYTKPSDCQGVGMFYTCETHIQDVRVEDYIIHESYRKLPTVANDIALLRLKKPVDFSFRNARSICLPLSAKLKSVTLEDRRAVVAGWGLTENGSYSSVLLKVELPIYKNRNCQESYRSEISDNEFCAGKPNKDTCEGDSGGPLMLEEEYEGVSRIVQYGIVSRGPKICGNGEPGVYTEVTKYMTWILDNIKP